MRDQLRKMPVYSLLLILGILLSGCSSTNKSTAASNTDQTFSTDITTSSAETSSTKNLTPTITLTNTPIPNNTTAPTSTPIPTEIPEDFSTLYTDYTSLAELFQSYGIRFGTTINGTSVKNKSFQDLVSYHFNSLTASNEMKAYCLLDQAKSQQNPDDMPVMNYTAADTIMEFASANGIQIRGHCLVWDSSMCDWFFREGYQNDADYADRETMKARLEYYITEVINHFETAYPGVIYCFDVVNEAVGEGIGEYITDDARHVRILRNGGQNLFYDHIGSDYVELSFLYAKNALEAIGSDIKLIYNDYNAFQEEKRDAICALVTSINSYDTASDGSKRKLCDGVGMQGYIGGYGTQDGCLQSSDIERIHQAINAYAALGVEVQITEMAVRNFNSDEASIEKHAEFYRDLFSMFLSINTDDSSPLTSISIWGLCDDASYPADSYNYKLLSPYGGLFTKNYQVKKAFYEVYDLFE